MSADNYLAIRKNKGKWAVIEGCASSDEDGAVQSEFNSRNEAIDEAQKIMENEMVEYGIVHIDKEEND